MFVRLAAVPPETAEVFVLVSGKEAAFVRATECRLAVKLWTGEMPGLPLLLLKSSPPATKLAEFDTMLCLYCD